MKKAAVIIVVAIGLFIYGIGIMQFAEKKNSAEASPLAEQTQVNPKFTVKEYNGKIALFVGDEKIPIRFLNINISDLREYDKQQFKTGIELNTLQQVLMLEEDFSS